MKTAKSGLLYKVEKEGTGDAPKDTDTVVVNYKGTLTDGKGFDALTPVANLSPSVWTVLSQAGPKV